MRILGFFFLIFLVLNLSLSGSAQWTPVVAKEKRIVSKIEVDREVVASEQRGTFFRSSGGSVMETWVEVVNGQDRGKGKSSFIEAKAGKAYMIHHDAAVATLTESIPLPRLPLSDSSTVIPEQSIKG